MKGKKTGGRKKGTPNKVTLALKEAILKAAENAGGEEGTVGYLKQQAILNPGPFLGLLGKILPRRMPDSETTQSSSTEQSSGSSDALQQPAAIARARFTERAMELDKGKLPAALMQQHTAK